MNQKHRIGNENNNEYLLNQYIIIHLYACKV